MDKLFDEVVFRDNAPEGEELFADLLNAPAERPQKVLARGLNYSHDAMIDEIIVNPAITQNELAKKFGYSVSWISQVINSDAFNERLAARKAELKDPVLVASMEEQFKGILARGLEITREKLESPDVSDNFVLRTMELSTRALGYGAKKADNPGAPTATEEGLLQLSNNLVGLLKQRRTQPEVLEGEFKDA